MNACWTKTCIAASLFAADAAQAETLCQRDGIARDARLLWEAGYMEGLGKPVIYISEKTKFDKAKTHFDTNHCTTVPWSRTNDAGFRELFIETLRRSLDQSS